MIRIDLDSPVPLEEQLRSALREAIARGEVAAGQELPSSRQLGGDLGIHFNTVARAYRRLRDEGLLTIGRGRGVYVRARDEDAADAPEVRSRVEEKLRDVVTEATLGGWSLERLEELFREHLDEWRGASAARKETGA